MTSKLLFGLADHRKQDSFASRLRRRRFELFLTLLESVPEPVRILDIGGTIEFWQMHLPLLSKQTEITLVNLERPTAAAQPKIEFIRADARDLSRFADSSFDICFSNSLIEHVGTHDDQRKVAQEIRRVARGYFVQTPNAHFPVEPHFLVPLWQFLPVWLRIQILRRRDLGWMPRVPNSEEARKVVESIRLLTAREMQSLFPDAALHREKVGFLTKALVAMRACGC